MIDRDFADICSHCAKEIIPNDRCVLVALVSREGIDLKDVENHRTYHTWCWNEIAGEDYDL